MRKVLLMMFAIGMFMALGSSSAMAGTSSGDKPCSKSGKGSSKCKPKPKPCPAGQERDAKGACKPKPCPAGQERDAKGACKPKPCPAGQERDAKGECKPKPCPAGQERDAKGECKPKPCKPTEINKNGTCVPRPADGPCSKADLVLLEDLLKGTGGLLCVYLGNNAPNADETKNCPKATLALPIDHLVGACLYLPPVDIKSDSGPSGTTPTVPAAPSVTDLPTSLTAVLDLVLKLKLK